jgi:hypothetical protein
MCDALMTNRHSQVSVGRTQPRPSQNRYRDYSTTTPRRSQWGGRTDYPTDYRHLPPEQSIIIGSDRRKRARRKSRTHGVAIEELSVKHVKSA